ncbi:hypothetical protein ACHHYP_00163 [Achlya hypogyna]|uniref:BZIP domain-containing protein n=1 Tax=Achlya hypogyna TaxID=1202772 RepID=A0A1V9ZB81_ACHHY|nr:hypothetical protein ACHHYP_00163 [Achlya hypogyna]
MPPHATAPTPTPWSCLVSMPVSTMEEHTFDHDLFAMIDSPFPLLAEDGPAKKPATEAPMKGEKRKLQVREASRRCRLKQKEEVTYLRSRVAELEQLVRDRVMAPPTNSDTTAAEVLALRQQNQELTEALNRSQSQMVLIQALLNKSLVDTMQTIAAVPSATPKRASAKLPSVTTSQRQRLAAATDCAVAFLTSFQLPQATGTPVLSIQRAGSNWFGEIWSVGSELFVSMSKEWVDSPVLSQTVVDRIWERAAVSSFADGLYTLTRQEKLLEVDANTHLYHRVESVLEMKVLEHHAVRFRRAVAPTTVLVGSATVAVDDLSLPPAKYSLGREQLGLLVHSVPQTPTLASVQLVGSYDLVGVPPVEAATKLAKHVLQLAAVLETHLLLP